ncbi:MAG TPA: UbiA family prenyltransferase, partial [Aggregatilineales bacterium]|nr:UbiA family prenyltransferase [Aggregatilineales bacterium]
MLRHLVYYGQLGRIGMSPLTISVPMLGALVADEHLPVHGWFALALVGLSAHLFGFGLNALIDLPLDRSVPGLQNQPLITEKLRYSEALIFTLLQIPFAIGIYIVVANDSRAGFAILCLSIILSIVYNLWSKRGRIPPLIAEIALAGSVSLLCFSGVLIRDNESALKGGVFAMTLGAVLLLLNSVPSGLKDIKTDAAFGVRSFVLAFNAQIDDRDRLIIPLKLWIYCGVLQVSIWIGFLWLAAIVRPGIFLSILILLLSLYGALHLRMLLTVRSF